MNPFLASNRERVNAFFLEMGMPSTATAQVAEAPVSHLPPGVREMSLVNVHRHLHQNASKLIKFISDNSEVARENLPEGIDRSKYESPVRVTAFFKEEIDYVLNKVGDPPLLAPPSKTHVGGATSSKTQSVAIHNEAAGNTKNVEKVARRLSMVAKGNANPYQVGRPRPRRDTDESLPSPSPSDSPRAGLLSVDLSPMVKAAGSTRKENVNATTMDSASVEMVQLESNANTVTDE